MITQVTQGIKISVKISFRPEYSEMYKGQFLFAYRITIENQSEHIVQLLKRHWEIYDSSGEFKEVAGDGVVGAKPILRPGDMYEYESACALTTEMGRMQGTYLMERKSDGKLFSVNIPAFEMYAPHRMN